MFKRWIWNTHAYACLIGFLAGAGIVLAMLGCSENMDFAGLGMLVAAVFMWGHFNFILHGDNED